MKDLNQLLLKFDLKQNYKYDDYYVSKSNFYPFKIINECRIPSANLPLPSQNYTKSFKSGGTFRLYPAILSNISFAS